MQEMHCLAVDLGGELRIGVHARFRLPPVVCLSPMGDSVAEVGHRRPRLPVVLMSGWASEVDPAKARAVGAFALLAKPFAMQQVTDLLGRLTRGQ